MQRCFTSLKYFGNTIRNLIWYLTIIMISPLLSPSLSQYYNTQWQNDQRCDILSAMETVAAVYRNKTHKWPGWWWLVRSQVLHVYIIWNFLTNHPLNTIQVYTEINQKISTCEHIFIIIYMYQYIQFKLQKIIIACTALQRRRSLFLLGLVKSDYELHVHCTCKVRINESWFMNQIRH